MNIDRSKELYLESTKYFPGGVNSPVRAFKSVEGNPLFIKKGLGSKIWDEDGNEYIDFCCSWGPLILGHAHQSIVEALKETVETGTSFGAPTALENELAKLILDNNRFLEKIRFVSSGTEATMSAIRLARGYTGRDKIIKFDGCYHGHADHLLVKAGSGLATFGTASSAGVPESFANETIVIPLNDKQAVEDAFNNYKDQIACIIIEPVPANNGLLLQDKDYLEFLRDIAASNNSLLIFDEVISGFRLGFCGASEYYNIQPDILTFGKIIGGGLPVGAYGASAEIMSKISPDGDVYQAGTLSGNPMAMAAGIAQLTKLLKPGFYNDLNTKTAAFVSEINGFCQNSNIAVKVHTLGSIFWLSFSDQEKIQSADDINSEGADLYKSLHKQLLENGVYFAPSAYEVGFVSSAHTDTELSQSAGKICNALRSL
ncbi:glutamate-1-semialdehyde 2,1-aminomutase [bacterium AH-315-C07]|nr:glutamate-1-semialdehyde 2,1-aminomutase [bacterium AH-315-C07]